MSGHYITKQQAKLYMKYRQEQQLNQDASAAKSGISVRSGYTIEQGKHHTQRTKIKRQHKTRTSPIDQVWKDDLVSMLEDNPNLQPTTLFIYLERTYQNSAGEPLYKNSVLRTLQRRVAKWKALNGPDMPVIFPQTHQPGVQALSDFTHMDKVGITINLKPFKHMLYHFRLVYSKWSYVQVIQSGETFQALSEGLQGALKVLGGSPLEHRTDSLSAAYKNIHPSAREDKTKAYEDLCAHYGMRATRNNKGVSHENGSVESAHGHLKNRIRQELILRGSADFESVAAYEQWVESIVATSNRRHSVDFEKEKAALKPLPDHPEMDYELVSTKVSSLSMITIRCITYSVPSRLAGHTLTVHIYQRRLDLYLGSTLVCTLERQYSRPDKSRYAINYKHVIHSFIKKPGAFRHCKYKTELIPNQTYQCIWEYLDAHYPLKVAPKMFLRLLKCAADYSCEQSLGDYVLSCIENGTELSITDIEMKFNQSNPTVPVVLSIQHDLTDYDQHIPDFSTKPTGELNNATI